VSSESPLILYDRLSIDSLQDKYRPYYDLLLDKDPLSIQGKRRLHFCGMVCPKGEAPALFVPRGYDNSEGISGAKSIMQMLAKYGKQLPNRKGESHQSDGNSAFASLVLDIATDYKQNGLFSQRVKIKTNAPKATDWKRTLIKCLPMFSNDGSPVYSRTVGNKFLDLAHNDLAVMQAATICEIIETHGWWLAIDQSAISMLSRIPKPRVPKEAYASKLRRFKQLLYDEYSLSLVDKIIAYWEYDAGQHDGNMLCGLKDFSSVWEKMLKDLVSDESSKWNSLIAKPAYQDQNNNLRPRSKGGVIDIVVEGTDRIVIADAKYYDASSAENAPGLGDILKQSFYVQAVRKLIVDKNIESYFVFPDNQRKSYLKETSFTDINIKSVNGLSEKTKCLYVPMNTVINRYIQDERYSWLPPQ